MTPPVQIEKHAPERRKKAVTTLHCGCTCCCCCCLHSIGSIVCAAVAPAIGSGGAMPLTYYYDEEIGQDVPLINKPGLSSVTFFWWLTCLLIFICFAIGIVTNASGSSLLVTAVLVLLGLPGLQLSAVLISLIVYACWPRPDKARQIMHLGKISAGIVIGSILGGIVMFGVAVAFGALR